MAVRHGDQPARSARAYAFERNHVGVVAVGAAPDFERQIGKIDRLVMGDADDVQVFHRGQRAVPVDRSCNGRIVIAGKQDDRQRRRCNHRGRAFDQFLRHAMAVECIAGEHHHVGGKYRAPRLSTQASPAVPSPPCSRAV